MNEPSRIKPVCEFLVALEFRTFAILVCNNAAAQIDFGDDSYHVHDADGPSQALLGIANVLMEIDHPALAAPLLGSAAIGRRTISSDRSGGRPCVQNDHSACEKDGSFHGGCRLLSYGSV